MRGVHALDIMRNACLPACQSISLSRGSRHSLYLVEDPSGVVVDGVVADRVQHVRLLETVHDLHFICRVVTDIATQFEFDAIPMSDIGTIQFDILPIVDIER